MGNTIIHTATRGHCPLGINMSHTEATTNDGVVLWRRLEMEMQTISPFFFLSDLNVLIFTYSAMSVRSWMTCVALCHRHGRELYIMDTDTAKVTFKFLCFTTILHMNVCCIMQEEWIFS